MNSVFHLPIKYSGKTFEFKLQEIIHTFESDFLFVSSLESICWLLNIRGNFYKNTPVVQGYLIISKLGNVFFFTYKNVIEILKDVPELKSVEFFEFSAFESYLKKNTKDKFVQIDPNYTSMWILSKLNQAKIIEAIDPIIEIKAIKNNIEIDGFIDAHKEDGIALAKSILWIKNNADSEFSELEISDILKKNRQRSKNFYCTSFDSIVGYKENGAIIHYHPNIQSNKKIEGDGLLLIDSGGHYFSGTTDVTRVIAVGKIKKEYIEYYTTVLKCFLHLAMMIFPKGLTGSNIDAIARYYLWQKGLDFNHGTGHGVGHFLSVHEGPQNISLKSNYVLKDGMVVSIEPGFYKEGEFGIRIENLFLIKESKKFKNFLEFETLTLVPFEQDLIAFENLTTAEIEWITKYNHKIKDLYKDHFSEKEMDILKSDVYRYK